MTDPIDTLTELMNADGGWNSLVDFIQESAFGFCGCGRPEENLKYIMEGLAHIDEERPKSATEHEVWFKDWVRRGVKVFGNERARYFFFYWCAKEELTEHGGAVPGWLSADGKTLLGALREMKKRGDFDD